MSRKNSNSSKHELIFIAAITMSGVCATIVALFRALQTGFSTIADNILSFDTCLFLVTSLLAYISIRSRKHGDFVGRIADYLFFIAMAIITVVGFLLVYTHY